MHNLRTVCALIVSCEKEKHDKVRKHHLQCKV